MLPRACSGELYEVLELDSQCTTAEVTQQYRRLALRYHPDRNAGTTVEQFQRIEEAHRVLSDPQQRQLYDTVGRDGLKQLGDYGGGMVGSLLLAVGNVAAGCLLVGIFSAALFVSLLIGCYKIDEPTHWPSWGVVLLPVWFFLPVLVLASVTVIVASVKRGLYVLLLPSVRLLMCVVIIATTAAALDHRLSPISAFIPWVIWYVLGTISDVVMMVPTVYRRTHSQSFSDNAAATSNSSQDPFLPRGPQSAAPASAANTRSQEDSGTSPSQHVSFATTPWRTRRYWRDLAELILEAVCVYVFIALAFRRALQERQKRQGAETASSSSAAPDSSTMSFWVVFAPLLVFFGVYLLVNAWEGFFASASDPDNASSPSTPLTAGAAFHGTSSDSQQQYQPHHRASSAAAPSSSAKHQRPLSFGERIASVLIRIFPASCGLYMSAMWAAKMEYEYNGVRRGVDPSAFVAFLPILVVLGALAFFVCCGGCLVVCLGGALMNMDDAAAQQQEEEQQQQQQQAHSPAQRSSGRSSPNLAREEGYRSTAARTPRAQAGLTAASGTVPSGGAARDIAIEQID